jgi:hypothetical protein
LFASTSSHSAKSETPQDDQRLLLNAYSTLTQLPSIDFVHIKPSPPRDLGDPELGPHLEGFIGYVLNCGDKRMTHTRYDLLRHLQRVRHHVSLELDKSVLPAFEGWARRANAVVFMTDGSVRDPHGRTLIDGEGTEDPDARIPWPPDALQRKARTEALLAQRDSHVPAGLPPVVSIEEVQFRTATDVAGRALALLTVAVRAESARHGQPLSTALLREHLPVAFDYLSPSEQEFLGIPMPSGQILRRMGWRYEAAALLAWALNLSPDLPYPEQLCDVDTLETTLRTTVTPDTLSDMRLRPGPELLDALDLHYRLHWITREVDREQRELPPGLNPDIVMERHYALNWLVRFENAEWDEVDTPT